MKEIKVDDGKLKAVLEFCYQGLLKYINEDLSF